MIDQLHIKNFKSIKDQKIQLGEINILIGANGVGKSNFISFFKLLRSMSQNELNTYVAKQGFMDNLMYLGERYEDEIFGLITFSNVDGKQTNRYRFNLLASNRGNEAFIKKEWNDYNDGTKHNPSWNEIYHLVNGKTSWILTQDINYSTSYRTKFLRRNFENFFIYHFHDTSSDSPMKKTARLHDNEYLRENGENLAAYLFFLQEKHPKSFRRIEKVIQSIAPFIERFNLKPARLNEEFIQLEWKEKGFDRYQNAHNLSDGTLRFIALTTLLLQPAPPKTIIIDEPELGLHPSAVNKLAGLIKKAAAKSQVIISTQSVNLVNNFDIEDIITVDKKNNESVFQRLNSERLEVWLEEYGIGDLWTKSVIGGQP